MQISKPGEVRICLSCESPGGVMRRVDLIPRTAAVCCSRKVSLGELRVAEVGTVVVLEVRVVLRQQIIVLVVKVFPQMLLVV